MSTNEQGYKCPVKKRSIMELVCENISGKRGKSTPNPKMFKEVDPGKAR
jgi:hypothetical protein